MAATRHISTSSSMLLSGAGVVKSVPVPLVIAYSVFLLGSSALYHLVMSDGASSIFTVAEMFQCLAVGLLAAQVVITNSVAGISARALMLHAIGLCSKLSSTLWLDGYLPVCDSGDWFFQTVDIVALTMELWLLYQILVVRRHSYQGDADTFPLASVVFGAFVLAAIFHADMNALDKRFSPAFLALFDTMWMAGFFCCNAAVLPQLWLINKTGGKVEALTSHHIASMAMGTMLSGVFMYQAREDITCAWWIEGLNHAVLVILLAHLLHLLLLIDFAYFYIKAVATQGLACVLDFESVSNFV